MLPSVHRVTVTLTGPCKIHSLNSTALATNSSPFHARISNSKTFCSKGRTMYVIKYDTWKQIYLKNLFKVLPVYFNFRCTI